MFSVDRRNKKGMSSSLLKLLSYFFHAVTKPIFRKRETVTYLMLRHKTNLQVQIKYRKCDGYLYREKSLYHALKYTYLQRKEGILPWQSKIKFGENYRGNDSQISKWAPKSLFLNNIEGYKKFDYQETCQTKH